MKLKPSVGVFCPGCPKKSLSIKKAPEFIIKPEEKKQDYKIVTILSKNNKRQVGGGLF